MHAYMHEWEKLIFVLSFRLCVYIYHSCLTKKWNACPVWTGIFPFQQKGKTRNKHVHMSVVSGLLALQMVIYVTATDVLAVTVVVVTCVNVSSLCD